MGGLDVLRVARAIQKGGEAQVDHLRKAKVTLMLAQSALAVPNGTVSLLGGGLTQFSADMPFAIAGTIEMPWDAAGVDHQFRLELLDSDGRPVMVTSLEGDEQPLR